MAVTERMRETIAPAMAELEVELVDVEQVGATVRITIDRPGGIDLDVISRATRRISHLLDEVDPLADRYTLEVSSPGLERPLRTPAQFARAIGSNVSVKTASRRRRRAAGDRSACVSAGDDGIDVEVWRPTATGRIRYDEIERARTVFEWGPSPRPGKSGASKQTRKKKKAASK